MKTTKKTDAKSATATKPSKARRAPKATSTPKAGKKGATGRTGADKAKPAPKRDPRLPAPGTVLTKKARGGKEVRCKVLAHGVEYKGTTFASLSAAGRAAAQDLGVFSRTINGFLFWGVAKAAAPAK